MAGPCQFPDGMAIDERLTIKGRIIILIRIFNVSNHY